MYVHNMNSTRKKKKRCKFRIDLRIYKCLRCKYGLVICMLALTMFHCTTYWAMRIWFFLALNREVQEVFEMKKTDESRYDWSASTLFWKHHLFSFKDDVYSMTNNSTDDNEKPTMLCYRHLTVELFFIFQKVGQWPFRG